MQYLIHTCPKRKWYVDEYLIPSMQDQGIHRQDIVIYNDEQQEGCLKAFMQSWKLCQGDGTWHLQDDVIISSNFRALTHSYDDGIVCGFVNDYSKSRAEIGFVTLDKMWYSFPCIRIPNDIMREFVEWYASEEVQVKYAAYIEVKKHVDVLFWDFLKLKYPSIHVLNLKPNIVNHVDHLIGGSLINEGRHESLQQIMALYWNEPCLIIQLEKELSWRRK